MNVDAIFERYGSPGLAAALRALDRADDRQAQRVIDATFQATDALMLGTPCCCGRAHPPAMDCYLRQGDRR